MPLSTVDRRRLPRALSRALRFGWKLVRVRGRSMMPTLSDGDYVLVRKAGRGRPVARGDIVCLLRSGEPRLIKRLGECVSDGRFRLSGDGVTSQPAIDLGMVDTSQIEGRVVALLSASGVSMVRHRAGMIDRS